MSAPRGALTGLSLNKRVDETGNEINFLQPRITVPVDEKPGMQAIGDAAPDLPPVAGRYPTVARDHEHIRYGT